MQMETKLLSGDRAAVQRGMAAVIVFVLLCALSNSSMAGPPEYMQMEFKVGQAYEIALEVNKDGALWARDVEVLPSPRDPKLRGDIQEINQADSTVKMFGVPIHFATDTEYVLDGAKAYSFGDLKLGQRVEISCKVDAAGTWSARKVSISNIKKSNKIKANLTRTAIDGKAPDTLEVYGIKILLVPETDINKPSTYRDLVESELFGAFAHSNSEVVTDGVRLNEALLVNAEYRQTLSSETDLDLSRRVDADRSSTEPYLRMTLSGLFHPEIRAMIQARAWKNYVIASDQEQPTSAAKLELTQLYLLAPNIGNSGLALQVGRQNFESPREWLFDDYLDAVRLYFFGLAPLQFEVAAIHAVKPLNAKFKTWTDFFAKAAWRIDKYSSLSVYTLVRKDSDVRNREPIWLGGTYSARIRSNFRPWLSAALMNGTDKGKTLRAFAYDLGASYVATDCEWTPSITAGYAFASGDDSSLDDVDHGFRQTGYEDNVSRFGGASKMSLYGLVLSPELSNLKVISIGAGCRPFEDASIELFYRSYRQHHAEADLQGSGLIDPPARPNGQSTKIGSAIDFVASSPQLFQRMKIVWSLGVFNPGHAYEPRQKRAIVNRVELNIGL